MADAQDLKSWDHKKSCRFESDHRHQTELTVWQQLPNGGLATVSESVSKMASAKVTRQYSATIR
jgi:hypothetical protein